MRHARRSRRLAFGPQLPYYAPCCVCVLYRPASSSRVFLTKADTLPSGGLWIHEIKHDGFRIIARKDGAQVKLYSRPGNDLTGRFQLIVETLANLRTRSSIIDGEAVCCGDDGRPSFDRQSAYRPHDANVFLFAFNLIELKAFMERAQGVSVRGNSG